MVTFLNALLSLSHIYLQLLVILELFKVRSTIWKPPIAVVCIYLPYLAICQVISTIYLQLAIYILLLVLAYMIVFRQSLLKSFFMGLGQMVLVACIEYIFQILLAMLHLDSNALVYQYQFLPLKCLIAGFTWLLWLAVRKLKLEIGSIYKNKRKRSQLIIIVYAIYLILYTYPNIVQYDMTFAQTRSMSMMEIYNLVIFFSFYLLNAAFIQALSKQQAIREQNETLTVSNELYQKSQEQTQGFRHDFTNILISIDSLAAAGDLIGIRAYLANLLRDIQNVRVTSAIGERMLQSPLLYGLLSSKQAYAERYRIHYEISVLDLPNLQYCEPVDFSRILGPLLDNALEAAATSKERYVSFSVKNRYGRNEITIVNSCDESVDLQKIRTFGTTTKENHSGIGLSQVDRIIAKYQAQGYDMKLQLHYNEETRRFIQQLTI